LLMMTPSVFVDPSFSKCEDAKACLLSLEKPGKLGEAGRAIRESNRLQKICLGEGFNTDNYEVGFSASALRDVCTTWRACLQAGGHENHIHLLLQAAGITPEAAYVRITSDGQTCTGAGYYDIESRADCAAAFDELQLVGKGSSTQFQVDSVSYSFKPKGCYSECYSSYAGWFCRGFNTHPTGNGEGVDTANNRFVLCATTQAAYSLVGRGVAGGMEIWNVGNAQGAGVQACYEAVVADNRCNKDYFTYVQRADLNCGCRGSSGTFSVRNDDNADYYIVTAPSVRLVSSSGTRVSGNTGLLQMASLTSVSSRSNGTGDRHCFNPRTEDVESWECDCWEAMEKRCQQIKSHISGFRPAHCMQAQMCLHPNLCHFWELSNCRSSQMQVYIHQISGLRRLSLATPDASRKQASERIGNGSSQQVDQTDASLVATRGSDSTLAARGRAARGSDLTFDATLTTKQCT
jgi:hypothetical protein